MKTLKCDFCEANIEGEDFDSWMVAAREHYGSTHEDRIKDVTEEDRKKWREEARAKFDAE